MTDRVLKSHLEPIVRGSRRWQLWRALAQCWAVLAVAGLGVLLLRHYTGSSSYLTFFVLLAAAAGGAIFVVYRRRLTKVDYQTVAREVEQQNPELHALLLTAVEQVPSAAGELNYLQQRLINEALLHYNRSNWGRSVARRNAVARLGSLCALTALALVLTALRPDFSFSSAGGLWATAERSNGVTITPGDTTIERGSVLPVLARFDGRLPVEARLVVQPANQAEQSTVLAKNLGDPVYAGVVSDIKNDLTYHVEYPGGRTRDFKVTVFDYPKLERADAKITYPDYTGLAQKTVKDTRRVSAVEGSSLDYAFFLNKPVASAKLVAKDKTTVPLTLDGSNAAVYHSQFVLDQSKRFELVLTDSAGRTNRMPSEFVLEALKSRPAELKLTAPKGDQRVSALEEVAFNGETSGDYGLRSYGIAYTVAGGETKTVELGQKTAGHEKRPINYVLPLETLGVQPDQLVSYYLWADDTGPDGKVRRNTTDMYFAEIRPFEEIYRENQTPDQGDDQNNNNNNNNGGQQGGNQRDKLTDLQKQIITATWNLKRRETDSKPSEKFKPDVGVIHDSQEQALEQLRSSQDENQDPKQAAFVDTAAKNMEQAAKHLGEAADKNSTNSLASAVTEEQAAYQALLKLASREFQVARSSRGQRGGQQQRSGQQRQRQLDQLDLRQNQNRYETQRQASSQQDTPQQQEQLQVTSRLKELAQRQQDVNDRLRELQAALQEARTAQEKQDIQDRLKRLREEQQDLLADVDELRQRMDRPENQSQMSQERQQLDQTRSEVQSAAESLNKQDGVSQALASGTRAQRELQQLQDDFRKKNSSQFSEAMKQMRDDARQLAQNQQDTDKKLDNLADPKQRTLSETDEQKKERAAVAEDLQKQKETLATLLDQMRNVSEQSETVEPLLSQQLYDTLRQVGGQEDIDKSLEQSSDLVQRGFYPQATQVEEPTRKKVNDLKQGVERAAENILGDGTEALRLARQELEDLKQQLDQELTRGGNGTNSTNGLARRMGSTNSLERQLTAGGRAGANRGNRGDQSQQQTDGQRGEAQQPGDEASGQQANAGNRQGGRRGGQNGGQRDGQQQAQSDDANQQANAGGGNQPGGRNGQQRGGGNRGGQQNDQVAQGGDQNGQPGQDTQAGGGNRAGGLRDGGRVGGARNYANGGGDVWGGGYWDPILGEGYVDWSDRLRAVEEMIDVPELRTEVTRIRDRARTLRLDYKKLGKKPDWAVVETQISAPLAEIRTRVDEELQKRQSKDALVPLDRDPVPTKYSELVRRYYEQLGKSDK